MKQYPHYEFRFFIDAGHGWLEVPLRLILLLNLRDKVSDFSYVKGDMVYLEEDCDAQLILGYLTPDEYTLEYIRIEGLAPMRTYQRYNIIKSA